MSREIDYSGLPEHMREHARGYVERGEPVGDFLYAVLTNDFVGAYRYADGINEKALGEWVHWLVWQVPHACWGSPDKVEAWIEAHG